MAVDVQNALDLQLPHSENKLRTVPPYSYFTYEKESRSSQSILEVINCQIEGE